MTCISSSTSGSGTGSGLRSITVRLALERLRRRLVVGHCLLEPEDEVVEFELEEDETIDEGVAAAAAEELEGAEDAEDEAEDADEDVDAWAIGGVGATLTGATGAEDAAAADEEAGTGFEDPAGEELDGTETEPVTWSFVFESGSAMFDWTGPPGNVYAASTLSYIYQKIN